MSSDDPTRQRDEGDFEPGVSQVVPHPGSSGWSEPGLRDEPAARAREGRELTAYSDVRSLRPEPRATVHPPATLEPEALFDCFPVGLARLDRRGVILDVNERLAQLLGRRRRTTVDQRLVTLLGPASQRTFVRHLTQAFLSGGYEECEVELAHGGEGRWVHLSTTREEPGGGPHATCVVAVWEITERRQAEQRLAQSEASFRSLIDELPDAVWVHRFGRLVYANQAARTLLEWGDGPIGGQPLSAWLHPDDRARGQDLWRTVERSRGPVGPWSVRLLDNGGGVVNAEAHELAVPFDGAWSNVTIARDLTERHRLQAQVIQNDRLASMGALSAGIAHEVNNPLTFILTNLETALHGLEALDAGGAQSEALAHVRACLEDAWQGAERVRRLVREMRQLSHFDDDRTVVDLEEVAEAALRVASKELEFRADLERAFEPELSPVLGNRGQLFQVVLNLLLNAVQAIAAQTDRRHRISVRTRRVGRWAIVEVEDDGPGIPEPIQHRVFEPFFTTKPVGEGTGLGLAICHGIVRQHEGELVLDSAEGRGTRLEVRLPVPEPAVLAAAQRRSPADTPSTPPPARGPGRRILLIDDEEMVGRAVARALRGRHEVVAVSSMAQAVARLERGEQFDLVLCDVMMPGGTGVDVHRWVEQHRADLLPRFVMMTGGVFLPEAEHFIEANEVPYVVKPIVRDTVERLLDRDTEG